MGTSQSSQVMPASSTIGRLASALHLNNQTPTQTCSLAHRQFAQQLSKPPHSNIDRSANPFAPLSAVKSQGWTTCCLVSPLMVIGTPLHVVNHRNGILSKKAEVLPVYRDTIYPLNVLDVIVIEKQEIGLMVLEKPFWRAGWAGISFVRDFEQLKALDIRNVSHPERKLIPEQEKAIHVQLITRVVVPPGAKLSQYHTVQMQGIVGSLYCKIVDKKPYLIGIQVSEEEVMLFTEHIYKKIQHKARDYIKSQGGEREILKLIDVNQFQIEVNS